MSIMSLDSRLRCKDDLLLSALLLFILSDSPDPGDDTRGCD